jgi:hypothetical protein
MCDSPVARDSRESYMLKCRTKGGC